MAQPVRYHPGSDAGSDRTSEWGQFGETTSQGVPNVYEFEDDDFHSGSSPAYWNQT